MRAGFAKYCYCNCIFVYLYIINREVERSKPLINYTFIQIINIFDRKTILLLKSVFSLFPAELMSYDRTRGIYIQLYCMNVDIII